MTAYRHLRTAVRRRVGITVLCVLALCCLCGAGWFAARYCRAVPDAVELTAQSVYGIGVAVQQQTFGLAAQHPALLDGTPVRAVTANAVYGQAAGLRFADGGWFLPDAANAQYSYAIVPDTLAFARFGNTMAQGEITLQANGVERTYEICGVYVTSRALLDVISHPAEPMIYLSRPLEGTAGEVAAQQALLCAQGAPQAQITAAAREAGSALFGTQRDLRARRTLIWQCVYLALIACLCAPLSSVLAEGGRTLVHLYEMNKSARRAVALQAGKALGCIGGACTVLWVLLSRISIPAQYLPVDNLFEWSHYRALLETFFSQLHSSITPDSYGWLTANYMGATVLCGTMACVLFTAAWRWFRAA